MEDFDWTSFTKRIAVKASLKTIYNAWTQSGELKKWFLERAEFYNESNNLLAPDEPVMGGCSYKWYWYLFADPMPGMIKAVNGKDFIQFTFEGDCLVDVNLTVNGDYTVIELRHYNIPTDDRSKKYVRLGCSNGWAFYLTNLKSIYEGGIDLRNKDENLTVMINN
nr:SRPBCC domain-containing protein [uncultured Mucilaginibacter sp.]